MGRLLALLAALIAGVLIAWNAERLPEPRPVATPAADFSAERAMADVRAIGSVPHPAASAANARVRDHLVRRLSALGLETTVRRGVGALAEDGEVWAGTVENVVGVLPGRDRLAPAVVLMAHYDSVPGSPGAADDAAGVAAAIEIVRAIKARGPATRDVIVLLTDGEEAGLLGANAFFRRDPMSRRAGLVINLEARGAGGRAQMFQTSRENGELIGFFQRTAVRPSSSSLAVFIYENMPNDTDLTEALAVGLPSLNYAFIGRQFDYHAPTATPQNLEPGSLQDLGDQVLSIAAAAAFADELPDRAPSVTYSNLFGDVVLSYPAWAGWLVLALAAGLVTLAVRRARRAVPFPCTDAARGAGALLFAGLGAIAFLQFARHATGVESGYIEQRFLLAQVTRWETAIALIGLGFLLLAAAELARGRRLVAALPVLAGLACQAFGGLDAVGLGAGLLAGVFGAVSYGRPVSRPGAWLGVLAVAFVLGLALQVAAPTTAFLVTWPLLLAAVAAAGTDLAVRRGPVALALLAVVAAITTGWVAGYVHGAFLSMDLMPLVGMVGLMAAFPLWPLAQPADGAPPGRWIGAVLVLAGLALTAWIRFGDPYDARHPETVQVVYHADLDARRAAVVSAGPGLPDWSKAALAAHGPASDYRHWLWPQARRAAPAPLAPLPPPDVAFAARADGSLALTATPPPGGRAIAVRINPTVPMTLERVGGVPSNVTLEAGDWTNLRWAGPMGVEVVLRPAGRGGLTVRASAGLPGWPAGVRPLPPKPADVAAWDATEPVVVTATRSFTW